MKFLVLGANGFIGRTAVDVLVGKGHDVVAVTRRGGSSGPATAGHPTPVVVDPAEQPESFASLLHRERFDALVNAAGRTGGSNADLVRGNVLLVAVVLDALSAVDGRRGTRLVHLGSAAEYAPPMGREPVRPGHPTGPSGRYGVTKLCGTSLVVQAFAAGEVAGTVLRVFNPIGPGSPATSLAGGAVRRFKDAVHNGSESVRFGPLDDERDFVDVRDVAEAIALAAMHPGPLPPIMNVASGRAVPARLLVEAVARAASFAGRLDTSGAGSPRSRLPWQAADISATSEALGWRPVRSPVDSMHDLWNEHSGGSDAPRLP